MKVCRLCKEEKPEVAFSKNKQAKDGLMNECKECWREISYKNREIKRKYMKKWQRENKERIKKYQKAIPFEKRRARFYVAGKIKYGKWQTPEECSECGGSEHRIEAHHEDYSKPEEVEWLCVPCHRYRHMQLKMAEQLV